MRKKFLKDNWFFFWITILKLLLNEFALLLIRTESAQKILAKKKI